MTTRDDPVETLLERHGRTYCSELGIRIERNEPAPLFQWLVAANLYSTRIGADHGTAAARALFEAGLTTPDKLVDAGLRRRVDLLNGAGFARMDESYSRMLGDMAQQLIDDHGGDLRRLREAAERNPEDIRRRLQAYKGIGASGAAIFCREVQAVWDELYPFADKKALETARALGLGKDAQALARLTDKADFPRLVAALIRCNLAGEVETIREMA